MFQVKMFRDISTNKLENSINNFLSANKDNILSIEQIQLLRVGSGSATNMNLAILTYKVKE